ncbi:hypothetical protein H696_00548 [Fonticula alba]|uniref:Uncharacterized protein n=1 Tax=Fonticula alba TaxID=691883 RepID=A0A058ZGF1_FONAL|nr:hypothetical protein H696_00548 [Fonticula alba]KCV72998.1 hypothetical protein H696_00548 [Fonticula alba]|eukprot:XP_009492699.1 hypothetical protein H696_00548 [Fonticula alba]
MSSVEPSTPSSQAPAYASEVSVVHSEALLRRYPSPPAPPSLEGAIATLFDPADPSYRAAPVDFPYGVPRWSKSRQQCVSTKPFPQGFRVQADPDEVDVPDAGPAAASTGARS